MDFLFNDELNRSLRSLNDANDGLGGGAERRRGREEVMITYLNYSD